MSDDDFGSDDFDEADFGDDMNSDIDESDRLFDGSLTDSIGSLGSAPHSSSTGGMVVPQSNGLVLTEDDVFVMLKEEAAKTGEIYLLSPEEALQVMSRYGVVCVCVCVCVCALLARVAAVNRLCGVLVYL
jgi:hypothetical protein